MKAGRLSVLIVSLCVLACSCSKTGSTEPGEIRIGTKAMAFVEGGNDFAVRLMSSMDNNRSYVLSPLGMETFLSLLSAGASEEAAKEIDQALGFGADEKEDLDNYYAALLEESPRLDRKAKVEYQAHLAAPFDAADLKSSFSAAFPKYKISYQKQQMKDGHILLTNDFSFKATWRTPFYNYGTHPFHCADGVQRDVPMMIIAKNLWLSFKVSEQGDFNVVQLPYGNGSFSMYVVIPEEGVDLSSVLKSLDGKRWKEIVDGLVDKHFTLYMPKFTISSKLEFQNVLRGMGVTRIFDKDASALSNISADSYKSFLQIVEQQGTIVVNEKGTEAYVKTGSEYVTGITEVFGLDHPFCFMIQEHSTGAIFFSGVYAGPEE